MPRAREASLPVLPARSFFALSLPGRGVRRELGRKAFHLSSVLLPCLAWILPGSVVRPGLVALAGAAVLSEMLRSRSRFCRYHFLRRTRTLLRPHERHGWSGATYMALAYALAYLLFPRPTAIAAMLFNGLGDAAAALVGKRWGRHRTRWGKSWEGFLAGATVNVAVASLLPGMPLFAALMGGVGAAALEFAPLPLDDNLRVTLGGALLLASALLLF